MVVIAVAATFFSFVAVFVYFFCDGAYRPSKLCTGLRCHWRVQQNLSRLMFSKASSFFLNVVPSIDKAGGEVEMVQQIPSSALLHIMPLPTYPPLSHTGPPA